MSKTRKGGAVGIVEALWAGTAVFAATKAKNYSSFITSVVIYGIVLMVVLAAASWLARVVGLQWREGMANGAFGQCPNGGTPQMRDGATVCVTAGGNVDVTTQPAGVGSA